MKCLTSRKKTLIEIECVWDCTLCQEKAELLCKQQVTLTTRTPKAQNQFYLLCGLGHFPESFNLLWPQLWCINYSKNSGAPACQVFILSSVMGCLCSGPYHRFETRKCSFPCQVDRAEKEGKTRRSQSLHALYAGSWKPSAWRHGLMQYLILPAATGRRCARECCKEGAGHPPAGKESVTSHPGAGCSQLPCHMKLRHSPDPGGGNFSQTTLLTGRAAASCGCFSLKGDCFYPLVHPVPAFIQEHVQALF